MRGGEGLLRVGEVQRMTAGTGVLHGEMNGADEELHFLQIWLLPNQRALALPAGEWSVHAGSHP
ncbi:pirin family protein [Archangium violaceum]|nr:pirin family protein [Archangium violaceum]